TPGSVMAADNVIKPGNPPYLEYVQATTTQKKEWFSKGSEGAVIDQTFAAKSVPQYAKREGDQSTALSIEAIGNPNLVYETKLVHSYEPTGVPVSILKSVSKAELIRLRMLLQLRVV